MARIRTIKPDFWRDDDLSAISPEAMLLAIGLLNISDDEGYFRANPKLIEADIFPLRELSRSTTVLIKELIKIEYIEIFTGNDSKKYGNIINFKKHQVINKPKVSEIKPRLNLSSDAVDFNELNNNKNDYGTDTGAVPSGREGKGKEKEEEEEEEEENNNLLSPQNVIDIYHNSLTDLPQIIKLTDTRKRQIKNLCKSDLPTEESWKSFFEVINKSDFLMGRAKDFSCTFDWIIKPANALKILEGNYINKKKPLQSAANDLEVGSLKQQDHYTAKTRRNIAVATEWLNEDTKYEQQ